MEQKHSYLAENKFLKSYRIIHDDKIDVLNNINKVFYNDLNSKDNFRDTNQIKQLEEILHDNESKQILKLNIPIVEQDHLCPKHVNFTESNKNYLIIYCKHQIFPAHLSCEKANLDLTLLLCYDKWPDSNVYHEKLQGDIFQINKPVEYGITTPECIRILCECNVRTRFTISLSFSPMKVKRKTMMVFHDLFTEKQKNELQRQIKEYENKNNIIANKTLEIIDKNKANVANHVQNRKNAITERNLNLKHRTKIAEKMAKTIRLAKHSERVAVVDKYDRQKEEQEERARIIYLMKVRYVKQTYWVNIIWSFMILGKIREQSYQRKKEKFYQRFLNIRASKIIKLYREFMGTQPPTRDQRTLLKAKNGISIFMNYFGETSKARATNVLVIYFRGLAHPCMFRHFSNQFIMRIRIIQIRFKKHMLIKKSAQENLVKLWEKAIIFFGSQDKKDEKYRKIKENLEKISSVFRNAILNLVIDKQLLNYIAIKYEVICRYKRENIIYSQNDLDLKIENAYDSGKARRMSMFGGEKLAKLNEKIFKIKKEDEDSDTSGTDEEAEQFYNVRKMLNFEDDKDNQEKAQKKRVPKKKNLGVTGRKTGNKDGDDKDDTGRYGVSNVLATGISLKAIKSENGLGSDLKVEVTKSTGIKSPGFNKKKSQKIDKFKEDNSSNISSPGKKYFDIPISLKPKRVYSFTDLVPIVSDDNGIIFGNKKIGNGSVNDDELYKGNPYKIYRNTLPPGISMVKMNQTSPLNSKKNKSPTKQKKSSLIKPKIEKSEKFNLKKLEDDVSRGTINEVEESEPDNDLNIQVIPPKLQVLKPIKDGTEENLLEGSKRTNASQLSVKDKMDRVRVIFLQ